MSTPQAPAAERRVIGAVMVRRSSLQVARAAGVDDSAFNDPAHCAIWRAYLALDAEHAAIDPVTVEECLRASGEIRHLPDGAATLGEMVSEVPTAENAGHWAAIVVDRALRRRAIAAAAELTAAARTGDAGAAVARLEATARGLRRALLGHRAPPTAEAVLLALAAAPAQVSYPSGLTGYDALTGGLHSRQLVTLVGPTGAGKTGLGITIATRLARELPVLWVSAELDAEEMGARIAAGPLAVAPGELLAHRVDPRDGAAAVAGWPIYLLEVDPTGEDVLADVRARASAVRDATGRAPAVVVDYLQLLAASAGLDAVRQTVSAVAVGLRRLARDLDVPAIAISSASRGAQARARQSRDSGDEDARDYLETAKESGDIEYASAVICWLDVGRHAAADGSMPARLAVAKSRRGRTGFVGLRFDGPTGRWWEDDAAGDLLGPARRAAEDDRAVLAAVARTRGRPRTWRELRTGCGLRAVAADDARRRLQEDGRIVMRPVRPVGGRGRRELIILPDWMEDRLPFGTQDVPSDR